MADVIMARFCLVAAMLVYSIQFYTKTMRRLLHENSSMDGPSDLPQDVLELSGDWHCKRCTHWVSLRVVTSFRVTRDICLQCLSVSLSRYFFMFIFIVFMF